MDQFHGHGAFAHTGSNPFGRAMAYVAGNEDAGDARLKIKWIAIRSPTGRTLPLEHQMLTGNQITLLITLDNSFEPIGAGHSAGVNEQRTGRDGFGRARFIVLNRDLLATIGAFDADDVGV